MCGMWMMGRYTTTRDTGLHLLNIYMKPVAHSVTTTVPVLSQSLEHLQDTI